MPFFFSINNISKNKKNEQIQSHEIFEKTRSINAI